MDESVYRFAEFALSPGGRRLSQAGVSVALPPKTFDALCLLVRKRGELVAKEEFLRMLWPGVYVTEANLTNIVVDLRKLLGKKAVQTVAKFGYRFTLPVVGEAGIDQAAYESFVRGKELMAERSLDSIQRARDLFTICVAADPQFATGWAWLGRASRVLEKFKGDRPLTPNVAVAAFQRAFAIDPDSACAHCFYTQLQVDTGEGLQAMSRLAMRIKARGEDAETLTGLVQALRCCGMLEESVAAHWRAKALDPTVKTSVAHTVFLQCDFASVFEHYVGKQYYLDAAAWVAMGQAERAASLLRTRLEEQPDLGPWMFSLMASLLAVLEGRDSDALKLVERARFVYEPEGVFYFARHCGMVNDAESAVDLIRRARKEGFWSSETLERDPAFEGVRGRVDFQEEIVEAKRREVGARAELERVCGGSLGEARRS
jgi:DNA-binding winged helix-turn-helix (wHTH) protein